VPQNPLFPRCKGKSFDSQRFVCKVVRHFCASHPVYIYIFMILLICEPCLHVQLHIFIHMFVSGSHISVHLSLLLSLTHYVHMRARAHTHTHTYIHTHTHTHTWPVIHTYTEATATKCTGNAEILVFRTKHLERNCIYCIVLQTNDLW